MRFEWMRLPDPWSDIKLLEAEKFSWGYYVKYEAPSLDELFASGCISRRIAELWPVKGTGKIDEDGDRFVRSNKPLKANAHRVQIIRYIHDEEKALSLPNVRWAVQSQDESESIDRHAFVPRHKALGRFQRAVRWFTCENVIFVDWRRKKPNSSGQVAS